MSSCVFNLSRENDEEEEREKREKRAMRRKSEKRFELVISNVLFTSVRISLFTHSPNQLYKLEEMSLCDFKPGSHDEISISTSASISTRIFTCEPG